MLLWRRDRLAQAVSLYKARVTQIWSSLDRQFLDDDDPRLSVEVKYDPLAIAQALTDVIRQETGWRRFFQEHALPYIEVCHEDFVSDPAAQGKRLLEALDIDPVGVALPAPRLERQGGADNDAMVREFRELLGQPAAQ
ncbi:MAG: Stf0 family sulfotransferase [Ectothiorhodospiraceae bacterium]|nr:Stf0 family sulfotransferase [Ectothiorhodospiraceae bacterium]